MKEIIPMACDHAGFELKEVVKHYLENKGFEVKDFGTYSNTILSNRIEDAHIENDRLKRENHSLKKKNDEHNDELREQREQIKK